MGTVNPIEGKKAYLLAYILPPFQKNTMKIGEVYMWELYTPVKVSVFWLQCCKQNKEWKLMSLFLIIQEI